MTVYPGVPQMFKITVKAGATTGLIVHGMNTTPNLGRPNPNRDEGYNARASADDNIITITLDAPVSEDTVFTVMAMV